MSGSESRPGTRPTVRVKNPDPYRWWARGAALGFLVTLPALLAVIVAGLPQPRPHPWAAVALELGVEPAQISQGESVFQTSCALCHAADGRGIPKLGKPLRNSAYVQQHSDAEVFALVAQGRLPNDPANTSGQLMPARGNRGLSDYEVSSVVTYLRTMQDPSQPVASTEAWVVDRTAAKAAAGSTGGASGAAAITGGVGYDAFVASCSACHGATGEGIEGLGKSLAESAFAASKTDKELSNFIKTGRPIWDPENTTGIDMPPKGGNPALSDAEITDIISYIRRLSAGADTGSGSTGTEGAAAPVAGGVGYDAFVASCSACHGATGEGIEGLGKSLIESTFAASKTDKELSNFIKTGRPIWDPENTTGIDMPPKGGNPALSDAEIMDIITYIRSIHK